jgi:glycine/D-amino acid oxidase-like deaminating enzyme
MAEWKRLAHDLPGLPLSWCGSLLWDMPRAELDAYAAEHASWGYDIQGVDRTTIARIEPNLLDPPDFALRAAQEGAAEPAAATRLLLADAERRGAQILTKVAVSSLTRTEGAVVGVDTSEGLLAADEVVLAAGVGAPDLAGIAGIMLPITTPPGLIVHSRPVGKLLNGLVLAQRLHMRQTAEGRIIAGADFGGVDPGTEAEETAQALFAALKAMLRDPENLELDFHTTGFRPTPKDGFPIVGRAGDVAGLYLAVMHSGVTLAPAIGLFAAGELLDGASEPLLAPYRLSRFD